MSEPSVIPSAFLLNITMILAFTKLGGMLSKRLGMPSVLGQVMTGIILGPTILGWLKPDLFLDEVGQIGVILLMFLAGLDTEMEQMSKLGKRSLLVAAGGVLLPFILGIILVFFWRHNLQEAIFVGTLLTATSVSITVQVLMEMGKLKTAEGNTILAAAIIDDILGILLLSVVVGMNSQLQILPLLGRITLFFVIVLIFGGYLFPFLIKLSRKYSIKEGRVTLAIACCLLFAWLAEQMGVATIIGAYLMGIFVGKTRIKKLVTERIEVIAYTFFVPIFFVGIGAIANLRQINLSILLFLFILVLVAIASKLIGSMIGALLGGFGLKSSLIIGSGMIARGEVLLIITSLGLRKGIIGSELFSGAVLLVLVSTLLTPVLLTVCFKETKPVEKLAQTNY